MKKKVFVIALLLLSHFAFTQLPISVAKTGTGNPIIFLPGFTAPGSVWDETVKHLDTSYTNYIVSYAGFNGLQPIATPWYDAVKKQLVEYIKKENLSHVTLIGHSMGGNLAIDLVTELPAMVTGVILVESLPCMRDMMMPGVPAASLQYTSPYNNQILAMGDEDFKKMAMTMAQNMTNTQSKVEVLTTWSVNAHRKTYVYGYTDLLKLDLRDKLPNINIHTLILGASFPNKEMIKANYEKQYANLKGKEILIAESSKHFIMFDQPEWLYTQVNKYLHQYAQ
ncbi:MAG: alpha/beta hydrolase [Ferruginibacter sp.]